MPIRFRCVYCEKLLGIARRKAGAVVNCPHCGQPLIVPSPEPEPQPAAVAAANVPPPVPAPAAPPAPAPVPVSAATHNPGKLFEQDDFDVLLEADKTFQNPLEPPPAPKRPKSNRAPAPAANPLPPKPFPVEQSLPAPSGRAPAPAPLPLPAPKAGMMLTTGKLVLALVGVFVLVVLAFGGGVLVGRMLH